MWRSSVCLVRCDTGALCFNPLVPFVLHAPEPEINQLGFKVNFFNSSLGVVIPILSNDIEFGFQGAKKRETKRSKINEVRSVRDKGISMEK